MGLPFPDGKIGAEGQIQPEPEGPLHRWSGESDTSISGSPLRLQSSGSPAETT